MNSRSIIGGVARSRKREDLKLSYALGSFALAIVLVLGSPMAYGQVFGAIFTTDKICDGVNLNLYNKKSDVWIDGGPPMPGAAGLPDGLYHVQVTSPNGIVLGSSVYVTGSIPPVLVDGGDFAPNPGFGGPCYELMRPNGNGGVHFPILRRQSSFDADGFGDADGYDDTPNNGGVYKLWISMNSNFPNNESKTDNFKVDRGVVVTEICALKYYDANGNGVRDTGEVPIPDWNFELWTVDEFDMPVELIACDNTDVDGKVCFLVDAPRNGDTRFLLKEMFPDVSWAPTTDAEFIVIVNKKTPLIEREFGNICTGEAIMHTKGFWQNQGCDIISAHPEYLTFLNTLAPYEGPLDIDTKGRDNCGGVPCPDVTALPFDNAAELGCYIVAPNNQPNDPNIGLAQQLAAFTLNALHFMGDVNTTFSFMGMNYTAIDLINAAVAAWESGSAADVQFYKNLLDGINNAGTVEIILSQPCPFTPVVCPVI